MSIAWVSEGRGKGRRRAPILSQQAKKYALPHRSRNGARLPRIRLSGLPIVRCRAGPAEGCAVPPILPSAKSALARRSLSTLDKIGAPAPRSAAPRASLTRPDPASCAPPVFKTKGGDDDCALRPHPAASGGVAGLLY